MKFLLKIVIITLFILSVPVLAQGERRVDVPGTSLTIIPPDGFEKSQRFPGFISVSDNSSIMITVLPVSSDEACAGFTKEGLASKGMTLIEKQEVTIGKNKGTLFSMSQKSNGENYLKWILIMVEKKSTILLAGTFPARLKSNISDAVKKSLLSVRLKDNAENDPFAGLTFMVKASGDLKAASPIGNNIIFTRDGIIPSKSPVDPVLIVGASISQNLPIANRKEFALLRIGKFEGVKDVAVDNVKEVTIDNLPGYEINARGTDTMSSAPLALYQVILYEDTDYYIIYGQTGRKEAQRYLSVFKTISASFKRNKSKKTS